MERVGGGVQLEDIDDLRSSSVSAPSFSIPESHCNVFQRYFSSRHRVLRFRRPAIDPYRRQGVNVHILPLLLRRRTVPATLWVQYQLRCLSPTVPDIQQPW